MIVSAHKDADRQSTLEIRRRQAETLAARLREPRRQLQVVAGPRQVGKTTIIRQVLGEHGTRAHYASADDALLADRTWLTQQWRIARDLARGEEAVLAIDEVQRVARWAEAVKALWDEDTRQGTALKVVLSGSAPLLVGHGLGESLAGRFERVVVPQWTLAETQAAFGHSVDEFIAYGGYPGAAHLIGAPSRWTQYVRDALIEATVSRDVLQLERVDHPALLRRLFDLAAAYAGQELSLTKILGQLQDRGNASTLAWYLELLAGAGMACGLQKYAEQPVRQRASSPKLAVFAPALRTAVLGEPLEAMRRDPETWGRQVEAAIIAHALGAAAGTDVRVWWWRERDREVDLVLERGRSLVALEVKSGARRRAMPGLTAFCKAHPRAQPMLVGDGGVPVAEFLSSDVDRWFA